MDALDCLIVALVSLASALSVVVIVNRNEDHEYRLSAVLIAVGASGWAMVDIISALTGPSMQMDTDHMRWFVLLAVVGVVMTLVRVGRRRD